MRRISEAGLALVKRFEGLRLEAYLCPAGVWTIGYGSTRGVKPGMTIDELAAERRLRDDLAEAEAAVERLVTVPLTDGQHASLVSLVYNIGEPAFQQSTLLRLLNGGDYAAVPAQLMRFVKAGGKRSNGLVRRRSAEAAMWVGEP